MSDSENQETNVQGETGEQETNAFDEQLEADFKAKLEEMEAVTSLISRYNDETLPKLQEKLDAAKSDELARVDSLFDSYVELINKIRAEARDKIAAQFDEHNEKLTKSLDVEGWQKKLDGEQEAGKTEFVDSASTGALQEAAAELKRELEAKEETYKSFVEEDALKGKTFFLNKNLVEVNSETLVSVDLVDEEDGFGESSSQLDGLTQELASIKTEKKSLFEELSSFKEQIMQGKDKILNLETKNSQITEEFKAKLDEESEKIKNLSDEKQKLLANFVSEEVKDKLQKELAELKEKLAHTIIKDIEGFRASVVGIRSAYVLRSIDLNHAKERVQSLCDQYGQFLKKYSWRDQTEHFYHELEKVETDFVPRFWNTYVVYLMKPFFAP